MTTVQYVNSVSRPAAVRPVTAFDCFHSTSPAAAPPAGERPDRNFVAVLNR